MSRRKKWSLLWIVIPILIVVIFISVSIQYLLDPDIYRNILEKSLTTALDREISIGKAKIYLWGGVGITFDDFRIKDRSLAFDLLQSKRLILRLKFFPLLKREIKWKQIIVDRPVFRLIRDKNGQFNIFFDGPLTGEKLKETQKKMLEAITSLFGGSLAIREGEVSFSDESLGNSPLKTEIRAFNFELSRVAYRKDFPFLINGRVVHSNKEGPFSIEGTIRNIPENLDLSGGEVRAEVKINNFDILHFWPYLKTLLPMETISGVLHLNAHYRGDFQGTFKASAKIKFKELLFDYPRVFSSVLKPEWANIDVEAQYDSKEINIPRFLIELPELWVKAKGRIYGIGSKEMGMEAEAQSSPFEVAEGKKFIPFRIITPDVSDHLYRSEGKGSFQIVSVRLAGKMPEIDHCDQLANAHVLSIEARLNGAGLKLPWNLPTFEDLHGQLLFQKGHLYLKEIEGRIFHSTLENINGAFYELLHIPTLQIDCHGRFDLTDLPFLLKTEGFPEEFSRALSSISILSGKANYSLSAKGLLKPPIRFQHQGTYLLSKTLFTHQQIPFPIQIGEGRVDLSHQDLKWSEAKVDFGHSSLIMNGLWKHGERDHPLEILARGKMDLKNLFALFQSSLSPDEVRSKTKGFEALSGISQISFKGKTLPGASRFSYEGEFFARDASFLKKGNPVPIFFKEGGISFSNLGIGFSKAKFVYGKSSLTMDGFWRGGDIHLSTWGSIDLKPLYSLLQSSPFADQVRGPTDGVRELSGEAEVRLKWLGKGSEGLTNLEGGIRLRNIFLQHRDIPVPLSEIEGSLRFLPEEIRVEGLKGKLGNSALNLSGTISGTTPADSTVRLFNLDSEKNPKKSIKRFTFHVSSTQLDLDPFFPKREETTPASFERVKEWLLHWSLEGKIEIDQGNFRSFRCRELKAEMKTLDGKLHIRHFQFKADGGDFWGEGWLQPTERGIRVEMKPRLSNMEAKAFLRTLFQKEEEEKTVVTGRMHVQKVELRGEGENFQKIKESLNGSLTLEVENGAIEKANLLAKIFSILNVSQWFKGRLPDLKTKGLPYRNITATLHIKDGIASTDDFLVDSDAMRITILGKVDLGKKLIDARVGVHPLVTIDVILSSVPIAGYILTGKDKAFLSYFYTVKGDLNDPKVEVIPLKSAEEPSWGIIKRLLETPLRPFQKGPSSNDKPR